MTHKTSHTSWNIPLEGQEKKAALHTEPKILTMTYPTSCTSWKVFKKKHKLHSIKRVKAITAKTRKTSHISRNFIE